MEIRDRERSDDFYASVAKSFIDEMKVDDDGFAYQVTLVDYNDGSSMPTTKKKIFAYLDRPSGERLAKDIEMYISNELNKNVT